MKPQIAELIAPILAPLPPREREIIKLRYGLEDGFSYTLAETAKIFKISKERVRQIECKALLRLQQAK